MGFQGVNLPTIADGIIDSDHTSEILSTVDTVIDYAEHGCSTDLSYEAAERIWSACMEFCGSGNQSPTQRYYTVTEPLSA